MRFHELSDLLGSATFEVVGEIEFQFVESLRGARSGDQFGHGRPVVRRTPTKLGLAFERIQARGEPRGQVHGLVGGVSLHLGQIEEFISFPNAVKLALEAAQNLPTDETIVDGS